MVLFWPLMLAVATLPFLAGPDRPQGEHMKSASGVSLGSPRAS